MKSVRVLVVDDDELDRLTVRRALTGAQTNIELAEAVDAEAARFELQRGGVECVLLDLQLPQVDGLTLLRSLRAEGVDVPVVMLTGVEDQSTAVELMKAGAADYLSKAGLSAARLEQSIIHAVRVYRAERSAAEVRAALEANERQYGFLAESLPQFVWTAGPDGSIDYCNQRMCDYTGFSRVELGASGWIPALHPEDVRRAKMSWISALQTAQPYEDEFRLLRASDRSYRWHLGRAVPLREADGAATKWFGTFTDIDDQKRTTAQLELERQRVAEANRSKDVFLATVSHEMRTPLTAILGWAQILLSRPVSDERRLLALRTIERNARAQAQLIEDLLDMSRIESGKLRLEVGAVNMAEIVYGTLETVRPAAEAKGLRLETDLSSDTEPLIGDAGRLQQIVSNLLTNAVKFSEPGGQVAVALRRTANDVELSVTDQGRGIEPDFLPYVFERFRQSDASIARSQGGLGLGLTIVRHLVELHGGTVEAHSQGKGKGAEFVVKLPRSGAPAAQPIATEARVITSETQSDFVLALQGLRVLLVDDEPDSRDLMACILEECQIEVTKVATAAEALAVFDRDVPDVLISDIGIPGETGYDLIRQVRARPTERGGKTPAVAVTAYARASDRTQALRAGFNMHMAKPLDPVELIVTTATLAGRLSRLKN